MNLSPRVSIKGILLTGLVLIFSNACKKENSGQVNFITPVALPATNIMPTSFTANWEADDGAVSYNLYVATDSNFANPVNGYNPKSITADSATLTGLPSNTNYYYKVVAINNQGLLTIESNIIYVQTPDPAADRFVYIGSEDKNLYCFYAGTGAKVWTFPTNGDVESSATISGGVLYFGSTDQRLYAIDPLTGIKYWGFLSQGAILTSPTVGIDGIYIASYSGYIYGVNMNGSKKWSALPSGISLIFSSPAYNNGIVYIGGQDNNLYAFDAESGAMRWSAATGDTINSSPAISNGIVYVGSSDRNLYAFDAATGSFKWKNATGDSILSSPTISNGIVYVGSFDGKLYAFDALTGVIKWSTPTGGRIQSSPAVSNGVVYAGSFDGKLYAFDAVTGTVKWSTATGGRVMSSPTVSNGVVYAGCYDNKLYAFFESTGAIKWTAETGGQIRMSSPTVLTFPGNVVLP
ncbi:MAG TPA: PQQ-binding-like beta-propeller repeat protein, partial [Puia sp.]